MSVPRPAPPAPTTSPSGRTRSLVRAVRAHPIAAALVAVAAGLWVTFSALVAMPPWAVLLLPLVVAVLAVGFLAVVSRRHGSSEPISDVRILTALAAATVTGLLLVQLVPYGRDRTQPAITGEPAWANDRTRALMVRACYGCHSSEVEYPSYASIAPISWMVQSHIDEGRSKVNYSRFVTDPADADETIEVIIDGEMPPGYYTRFGRHPEADLTPTELQERIDGLRATPGMGKGLDASDDSDDSEGDD